MCSISGGYISINSRIYLGGGLKFVFKFKLVIPEIGRHVLAESEGSQLSFPAPRRVYIFFQVCWEAPEIIWWWCKLLFMSNPTAVKVGLNELKLSWGCDNTILMIKRHLTLPNHANQTKPNKTRFRVTFAPFSS